MKQMAMTVSALCMFAALYDQILQGKGCRRAVRMVLALEICRVLLGLLKDCASMLF